jgi:hypothetical protein
MLADLGNDSFIQSWALDGLAFLNSEKALFLLDL